MKYGILSLLALAFGYIVYAQDITVLVQKAEKAEKDLKETEALQFYKEILGLQPLNTNTLCKAAELTARINNRHKDAKQRAALVAEALPFVEDALKVSPQSAEAHAVKSDIAGKLAALASVKEKAAYLRDQKFYADTTLQIDANNAKALYQIGKWNFDVANLNAGEKAAVKVLFGGVPKASVMDAIKSYEKARIADPSLLITYLDLAKAYVKNHQTDKAIEVLNRLVKLPPKTGDDQAYKAEGKTLLASLQ